MWSDCFVRYYIAIAIVMLLILIGYIAYAVIELNSIGI
jgi:hypothetical protein